MSDTEAKWQRNTGVMPINGEAVVEVRYAAGGEPDLGLAKYFDWAMNPNWLGQPILEIEKWQPSDKALPKHEGDQPSGGFSMVTP